jgi:hypothetical protein
MPDPIKHIAAGNAHTLCVSGERDGMGRAPACRAGCAGGARCPDRPADAPPPSPGRRRRRVGGGVGLWLAPVGAAGRGQHAARQARHAAAAARPEGHRHSAGAPAGTACAACRWRRLPPGLPLCRARAPGRPAGAGLAGGGRLAALAGAGGQWGGLRLGRRRLRSPGGEPRALGAAAAGALRGPSACCTPGRSHCSLRPLACAPALNTTATAAAAPQVGSHAPQVHSVPTLIKPLSPFNVSAAPPPCLLAMRPAACAAPPAGSSLTPRRAARRLPRPRGAQVKSIAAGHYHSGCTDSEGRAYLWGHGAWWQLGSGDGRHGFLPRRLPQLGLVRRRARRPLPPPAARTRGTPRPLSGLTPRPACLPLPACLPAGAQPVAGRLPLAGQHAARRAAGVGHGRARQHGPGLQVPDAAAQAAGAAQDAAGGRWGWVVVGGGWWWAVGVAVV